MSIMDHTTLSKAPELEPNSQKQFSIKLKISFFGQRGSILTLNREYNQHILGPTNSIGRELRMVQAFISHFDKDGGTWVWV